MKIQTASVRTWSFVHFILPWIHLQTKHNSIRFSKRLKLKDDAVPTILCGAREGTSSVHLVLSWTRDINLWERHINSWERDIMSWPRDRFVKVTTSLCRGLEMLCWGNNIHFSLPGLLMLREPHIFLVATSLMHKQIYNFAFIIELDSSAIMNAISRSLSVNYGSLY